MTSKKENGKGKGRQPVLLLKIGKTRLRTPSKKGTPPPPKPKSAEEPEQLHRPRLYVNDVTPESLALKLAAQPKGLMVVRDELSGWIGNMDRYSGGSGERAFWLEAYGGRPYSVDRVKHGDAPITIQHLAIPIIGGLVCENISKILSGNMDDGLAARFLFIWPDPRPPTRPSGGYNTAPALDALRRLQRLQMGMDEQLNPVPIVMRLEDAAVDLFQKWREENYEEQLTAHRLFLNNLGKLGGITLRLALILELMWWAASDEPTPPETVSLDAIAKSADMIDYYFKPMSRRVYGDAAVPEVERSAAAVAREIKRRGAQTINLRVLR
jgi:hypothetical protein